MTHGMSGIYGPQTPQVEALIERSRSLTADEVDRLRATQYAERDMAWHCGWEIAWQAARDAASSRHAACSDAWKATWKAAWSDAWKAAWALVVRDVISPEDYRILVQPWASVCGWPHPDDAARYGEVA